jgi:hypothetical protein
MSTPVAIAREWEGETAAIFASGPSMSIALAEQCRQWRTIAINNQAIDCAPWADIIYGSDAKWWRHYMPVVAAFPGRKLSVEIGLPIKGVEYLRPSNQIFDERPCYLSTGANSGYAALCLAAKLGARRILLYGYDMGARNGRMRRHDYPASLNSRPRFSDWLARFQLLAPQLRSRGVEVINCTPGSSLGCFPFQHKPAPSQRAAASPRRGAPC